MKNHAFLLAVVLAAPVSLLGQDASAARIQELEKKLNDLEQKYRVLERRIEIDKEGAAEKAKTAPTVTIGASGFQMRSADTNFVLRLRGMIQADSRWYADDGGIRNNDTFLLRRARPIFEGTVFRDFDFMLVPEFGGTGGPSILDAYLNYKYSSALQLRIGKMKEPVGLEQLQSDSTAFFIERGLPSQLTPNRDLGIQLHGDLADGFFQYQVGAFNGIGDNRTTTNADTDDEKDVVGRVFFHPFVNTELDAFKGLGLGIAGSYGVHEGDSGLPASNGYVSDAQQPWFRYEPAAIAGTTPTVTSDGEQWRISPQAYYYYGPFGLLGEYVVSSQDLRLTRPAVPASISTFDHHAWQLAGSWVITGEDASYRGVNPRRPLNVSERAFGAFEVVARYGVLDIDDDVFAPTASYANPARWATKITSYGLGLNWYLNRHIRSAVNFYHADFKGGGAAGTVTAKDENAIITRVQLAF